MTNTHIQRYSQMAILFSKRKGQLMRNQLPIIKSKLLDNNRPNHIVVSLSALDTTMKFIGPSFI